MLSTTPRTTLGRKKHRAVTDRSALHAVLDEGLICHLGIVRDGVPLVLPTGYGRDGDTLYLHGSTGAASLRTAAHGLDVCVTVTLLDGIVYSRSVNNHSMNYRSAVILGQAKPVVDAEAKMHGLKVLTDHLAPGSWEHAREVNEEIARLAPSLQQHDLLDRHALLHEVARVRIDAVGAAVDLRRAQEDQVEQDLGQA